LLPGWAGNTRQWPSPVVAGVGVVPASGSGGAAAG
jgi:hypothetical protein